MPPPRGAPRQKPDARADRMPIMHPRDCGVPHGCTKWRVGPSRTPLEAVSFPSMFVDRNAAKSPATPVTDGLPWERRRWAIAAIFAALAMASLDTAIANIALPAISTDLHVSPAEAVWVVNVYQIA